MKKISVIIPVYNVENDIRFCLDSVLNQTYKNLQIILVDDGSTDSSGDICDEYKNKDSRIQVIHKQNGGLSDARNKGLEIADGDYIAFLDSDDYIYKTFYEELYNLITKYDADISECNFLRINDYNETAHKLFENKNLEVTNEEIVSSNIEALNLLYGAKLDPYVKKQGNFIIYYNSVTFLKNS